MGYDCAHTLTVKNSNGMTTTWHFSAFHYNVASVSFSSSVLVDYYQIQLELYSAFAFYLSLLCRIIGKRGGDAAIDRYIAEFLEVLRQGV